jgi:uncharacterized protein (UPF0335 family)
VDKASEVRSLKNEVQELRSAVDDLYKKSSAQHADIKVILTILKKEFPEAARRYGF